LAPLPVLSQVEPGILAFLVVTQELIANMLGVRREGVTAAAGRLQEQGLISCVRGRIRILDRRGLEASVCECYKVVKDE
jgi:CRP-like cAMP-binding protein